LGIRSGATPRGPIHITTPLRNDTLKPDISTLPELGHFYFALTHGISIRSYVARYELTDMLSLWFLMLLRST